MGDIIKDNHGSLKIAFPTMRGTYMLPCTLPIFNSLYPNVQLNILESHSNQLESMILNGETDLAFLIFRSKALILTTKSSATKRFF